MSIAVFQTIFNVRDIQIISRRKRFRIPEWNDIQVVGHTSPHSPVRLVPKIRSLSKATRSLISEGIEPELKAKQTDTDVSGRKPDKVCVLSKLVDSARYHLWC